MKKITLLLTLLTANFINLNAQVTTPGNYCSADFDDMQGFPVADAINSVSFGTINNVSNAQFAAPHYVHYNNLSTANFNIGATYQLSVSFDVHGGAGYGVWIDYNHNNTFETSEKVSGTTGTNALTLSSNTIINESITIPATALTGSTRMRVRIVEDDMYTQGSNFSILPCNASTSATDVMDWGETEDYTIILVNPVGINESLETNKSQLISNAVDQTLIFNATIQSNTNFQIVNINGQVVQNGTITNRTIDIQTLANGLYFIQLMNGKTITTTQKFIKSSK